MFISCRTFIDKKFLTRSKSEKRQTSKSTTLEYQLRMGTLRNKPIIMVTKYMYFIDSLSVIFVSVINRSQNELLFYKQIFKPLLNLIRSCESSLSLDLIEKHMIVVLNQVCVSIRKSPELLQLCFYISAKYGPSEFVIFSFMIPFYLYKSDQTDFQLISDFQKNQLRPLEMLVTISVFYYTISMQ
ncbi:unnamed protein product [Rotaria magnacalcarata]|uniref:Uncharacterized protein n=3 Tax=Rotaria magnacalcarata TaxID=392030 RepID=A0A815MB04_9BILA|nr:unnamed protein product [Rotaria magnacalcarata]